MMAVADPRLRERPLKAQRVGPGVLRASDASALANVEQHPHLGIVQGAEKGLEIPLIDAYGAQALHVVRPVPSPPRRSRLPGVRWFGLLLLLAVELFLMLPRRLGRLNRLGDVVRWGLWWVVVHGVEPRPGMRLRDPGPRCG